MSAIFFKHLSDYPSDEQTGWSDNLQGVSHDEENWFITENEKLWKINAMADLKTINEADAAQGIFNRPIPDALKDYNHMGDLDHYNGHLFVPMEQHDGTPQIARIACFNAADLSFEGSALIT